MANNLYEYYTGQGKTLPSVADRQGIASSAGIQNYTGDANQNATLLNYLQKPATTVSSTTLLNGAPATIPTAKIDTPIGTFQSPETLAAQKAQADYLNTLTASAPDEAKIREQKLQEIQASIDATNNVYADQLARAKQVGAGRLGTATAISARTGNLGSDFGNAQYNTQEQGNEDIYKSIENERLAKIQSLLSQAKTDASAEYKNKREEFTKGLDSRLAYYQSADQRKVDNTSKALNAIITKGLDPNSIDPTSLKSFATYYGIDPKDITAGYPEAKKAYNEALIKANPAYTASAGAERFAFNPTTGKYEKISSTPAKTTAGTGGSKKIPVAAQIGNDVADVLQLFTNKITQNNWKGINPNDYNYYRKTLLETYGSSAVKLLDSEIKNAGLSVDRGN